MRVYAAELLSSAPLMLDGKKFQILTIRFHVGSGTYIRSLAEELGAQLGYPASLYNLRRTKVGEFSIDDAQALETFAASD
jgi:tRNA pseudouridine55 synthase